MEQKRRWFAFSEEESSLARRMDARSSPVTRSAEQNPSDLAAGIGSGHRALGELGQNMAPTTARGRSSRSSTPLLSFASTSCTLLPWGPARRNLSRGDASVATSASGTHARSACAALVSAARSSPASGRGSLAPVQPNCLEASAENWVYAAQATEEPVAY